MTAWMYGWIFMEPVDYWSGIGVSFSGGGLWGICNGLVLLHRGIEAVDSDNKKGLPMTLLGLFIMAAGWSVVMAGIAILVYTSSQP